MFRRALLLVALGALALTAVPAASPRPDAGQALAGFKLGLVLPTSSRDLNWSQTMAVAARQVARELDIKLSLTDNVFDPTAARPLFQQLLGQKYNLIMAHSFSYAQLIRELAGRNPKAKFIVAADGERHARNLSIVTYSYYEVGYSQCWLAAKLSKKGVIGNVGAAPVPYNTETNTGCRLGAKAANPRARVIEAFTNDFADQQKGREVAQSLLDKGADVIFVSGGTDSSLGALALCGARRVPCTSTMYDNRSVAPKMVVSSTIVDWRPWLRRTIRTVAGNQYKAFTYDATFGNRGLAVTPFNGPSAKLVSASVRAQFAAMVKRLARLEIKLPRSKAHPGYR
jgi:basic membrane protein A